VTEKLAPFFRTGKEMRERLNRAPVEQVWAARIPAPSPLFLCPQRPSDASSRREQSPLPTLAGFVFVAENIASHDGPLSTFSAQHETAWVSLPWPTRRVL
jgi:hypothetical protein